MKIIIPESLNDITLAQFQKYDVLTKREDLDVYNFNKRKIEIFTGVKANEVDNIKQTDLEDILNTIDKALTQTTEFKPIFKIKDIEFGFIPNLDDITGAEFSDLSLHGMDVESLNNVMAILFRPIAKKDSFGNYSIIPYQGTKLYADVMKYMPMSIVNGALVFFSSLANELLIYTQRFTKAEQERENKQVTTLKSGDGMQLSKV